MTTQTGPAPPETGPLRPFEDAIAAAGAAAPADASPPREEPSARSRPAAGDVVTGLLASAALIAGVSGGGASAQVIVLAGVAGLAAGALAAAAGEYAAVSSRNELVRSQARRQGLELLLHPGAEEKELAGLLRSRGLPADLAGAVARQVSADPEQALTVRLREQFGADHRQLSSPAAAAAARLAAFAAGALIPLLPYLAGYASLAAVLVLAGAAAPTGGGLAARTAGRPVLRGALRQLLLGVAAVGIAYLAGHLAGGAV
jgi:VIT1/CCC1 family predicted Fe2+/Mn2+ transporter